MPARPNKSEGALSVVRAGMLKDLSQSPEQRPAGAAGFQNGGGAVVLQVFGELICKLTGLRFIEEPIGADPLAEEGSLLVDTDNPVTARSAGR